MTPARTAVATIVAGNYVAQARVLVNSLREHNPGMDVVVLAADATTDTLPEIQGAEVIAPSQTGLSPDRLRTMSLIYTALEFCTALKPVVLAALLDRGYSAVCYLDADIRVYAPLDSALPTAHGEGVVLTPHLLDPPPRDGLQPGAADIMEAGLFNLGFAAVDARARPFLSWWQQRLELDAINDPSAGLFTDQRWADWAPTLFGVEVARDRGLNVAYWNVHERGLRRQRDGWMAGDGPLRFFHFSGFRPEHPDQLTAHFAAHPRTTFATHPELVELCGEYAAELLSAGHSETRMLPYRLDTAAGVALTPPLRRIIRDAILTDDRPPDPDREPDAFRSWLHRLAEQVPPVVPTAEEQLQQLLRSKTFRWTHPLRALYGRLRRGRA